ncbi:plasmepsin 4 [Stylonychia lemnae]|uniref:Plasmepsin 4 n=1 Tax=Stylonychia lemnae TaxID=5949 RepID=A0A078AXF8_STYLE|nr:plasmepsin 4 [Stylonychia lemnae]|eukprot:CDW86854.1 plasmepsin 4 [Stylonychia lemnae]
MLYGLFFIAFLLLIYTNQDQITNSFYALYETESYSRGGRYVRKTPRVMEFQQTRFKVSKMATDVQVGVIKNVDAKFNPESLFYATIFIGSESESMKMLLDTTSSVIFQQSQTLLQWLIVAGQGCENWTLSQDQLSLSKSTQAFRLNQFKFITYKFQSGYKGLDGIIGLSREYVSISRSSGPLFVKHLKNEGKIYESIYALSMADDMNYSYIDIGTYQLEDSTMHVIWFQNQSYSLYWQCHLNAYMVGRQMYRNVLNAVLYNKTYYLIDKYVIATCNISEYQSIYLRLDNHWFEIKPESYVLNQTVDGQLDLKELCTLGIIPSTDQTIILGNVFIRNYYTIFDLENDQLGLYMNTYLKTTELAFQLAIFL